MPIDTTDGWGNPVGEGRNGFLSEEEDVLHGDRYHSIRFPEKGQTNQPFPRRQKVSLSGRDRSERPWDQAIGFARFRTWRGVALAFLKNQVEKRDSDGNPRS